MHLPSRNPIALQLARLVILIAQGQLPHVLSFVATMGMLSVINKIAADAHCQRRDDGMSPELRLANSQPFFTGTAFKILSASEPMKRAKKSLAPIQLGLDVKGGPACKAVAARTAHHEGFIVLTDDIRNAFNEVKREKMIQAVS